MRDDHRFYGGRPTSYASPRRARAAAARDAETRSVVERLLALNAVTPDNARALQDLTPGERSALERLRREGLAREVARDLWWLHPFAWDDRFDGYIRQQVWTLAVVAVVALALLWLKYLS
jgi:hypothetical protein